MTNRFTKARWSTKAPCDVRSYIRTLSVLLCLSCLGAVAYAQDNEEEAESLADPKTEAAAYDIAQRTMSPFCPGRTLADCPSDKAAAWRQDIRSMLAEGKSGAEISRILNERSGANLTGTPESSIGWMLPVGLLVGAVAILALVIVRFRKDGEDEDAPEVPPEDEDDEPEDDEDDEDDEKRKDDEDDEKRKDDDELEERLRRELEDED